MFYAGLGQAWSLFSGPITIFLVTRYFSPQTQGYFYTFAGVLGLSVFLELGFSQCIIQFASHEFARLRFGPGGALEGDAHARSRLISLGRLSLKWYGVMALLAVIGLGLGGSWFFWSKHDASVAWVLPWWSACVMRRTLTGAAAGGRIAGRMQPDPIHLRLAHILPGDDCGGGLDCDLGRREFVHRAGDGVLAGSGFGGGLLVVLARALARSQARRRGVAELISWRREIWPFHWRIAISCVSGYFIFNFFTPVLFYFHGPVLAGQMGATMSLVFSLSALAQSWTVSKGPRFGMLISRREFAELDRLSYRATAQAVGICILGGLALVLGLMAVRGHFAIGTRFLDPGPTSLLVLATVVNQVIFGQATYLRAHKQEPFMLLSLVNGLATGLLVAVLGCFFEAWGVSIAYALVQITMLVWASQVWRECRRKWHQAEIPETANVQA